MSARILVADDSVTIQKVVELTFSKEDFLLIQARSGEEAIKKAKEERPDLVLLDLVMPDKNGYEVCEALRAEPALQGVPIVLLAGTFEPFDRERGMQSGATDFVNKPFESQVLIGKVKQLLFQRSMDASARPAAPAPAPRPEERTSRPSPPMPAPVVPPSPPAAMVTPPAAAPAAPEQPAQDRLWQLLESGPAAAKSSAAALPPLEPPLDLSILDQSPLDLTLLSDQVEATPARLGSGADALPLPESLSLDDLLLPPSEAETPEVPVFELPPDDALPTLQLTQTEPPALEVDAGPLALEAVDAIDVDAGAAAIPELSLEIPELEAAPLQEVAGMTEPDVAPASGPAEAPLAPVQDELPPLPEMHLADKLPGLALPELALPTTLVPAPGFEPEPAVLEPVAAPVDLGAMRQAVTERVAEALARELSQKLVERIEKVVWEVVPDLAEILIAKEIERIRLLADEPQKSS